MTEPDLEGAIARFGETALRIKQERDWLFAAIAPFAAAYEAASDPGTSDLDNEQPFHLTVDLGDCRAALAAFRAAKATA